jgi:hypothetical protein
MTARYDNCHQYVDALTRGDVHLAELLSPVSNIRPLSLFYVFIQLIQFNDM